MSIYQDKYIKMLNEIEELERKHEEAMLLVNTKEKEKKDLEEKQGIIAKQIENLKLEQTNMLNTEKYLSKLIIIPVLTVLISLILHYKTYDITISNLDKVIYYIFILTSNVVIFNLEVNIIRKLVNKKLNKVENSMEYKKLLETINVNEAELENISRKQTIVVEEYLNATLNYSAVSASLKIKKEILEEFKEEVSVIVVSNLNELEEKPITRIKRRDNLND